jgi:hypothetical protein
MKWLNALTTAIFRFRLHGEKLEYDFALTRIRDGKEERCCAPPCDTAGYPRRM